MKTALDSTPPRLKEVPVEGTPYFTLEPVDPKQYLTIPERVAIARRIQELAPKLPHYVITNRRFVKPGAEAQPEGEAMETPPKKENDEKKPVDKPASAFHSRNDPTNSGHAATLAADAAKEEKSNRKGTTVQTATATNASKKAIPMKKLSAKAKKPVAAAPKKPTASKSKKSSLGTYVAGVSAARAKRANGFNDDAKITLIVKDNPKRSGSEAHRIYAKYRTGLTVGEFLKKGGTVGALRWDVQHKFISVK